MGHLEISIDLAPVNNTEFVKRPCFREQYLKIDPLPDISVSQFSNNDLSSFILAQVASCKYLQLPILWGCLVMKDSFAAKFSISKVVWSFVWVSVTGHFFPHSALCRCWSFKHHSCCSAAQWIGGGGGGEEIKPPWVALVWLLQTAILCFPAALRHFCFKRGALKINASAQTDYI